MNTMDLMTALGSVKDTYVLRAEEFREQGAPRHRMTKRRTLLIAAVIALTLLLVGCTVVYVLRLQDLEVGQYQFYVPTVYDKDGEIIPVETLEPVLQLSMQGVNQEALAEWVAFTNTYDPELKIAIESDAAAKAGKPWDIPENYNYIYGCYSQEMVDKLNEIVQKYQLELLSADILCQPYEGSVLLRSLGLERLTSPQLDVEYGSGSFSPEGTFSIAMMLDGTGDFGTLKQNLASYRYSRKAYFDPLTGTLRESDRVSQWNYTRTDGQPVLLVLGEQMAHIYADLPDAFITIYLDPVIQVDGQTVPMTREALEQISEWFALSITPKAVSMEQVEQYRAEAMAEYRAKQEADQAAWEASYHAADYKEFVEVRLAKDPTPQSLSYLLRDLNGDGVEELIISGREILSMKDGMSYRYFDWQDSDQNPIIVSRLIPCQDGVFQMSSILHRAYQNFYQANADSVTFLTGVYYDEETQTWYRSLNGRIEKKDLLAISQEEAQQILDSYPTEEVEWLPLTRYGDPELPPHYADPYAQYLAMRLYRFQDTGEFQYCLMDIDGNGVQELVTHEWHPGFTAELKIQTLKDGKLVDASTLKSGTMQVPQNYSYICEGGILEWSDEEGTYFEYSRLTPDGVEMIERIVQDPITQYWGRVPSSGEGYTIRKEEAMAVIDSYRRIELNLRPFSEYPFPDA